MATSCPDPGGCGTQAPVWLDPSSFNETQLMSKVIYNELTQLNTEVDTILFYISRLVTQ